MSGRLLLASDRAVPGGAQLALASVAPALVRHGWQVEALVAESGDLVDRLRAQEIAVTVARDPQVVRSIAPDVIVSMGAGTHAWLGAAAQEAQIDAAWWLDLTPQGRPKERAALALRSHVVAAPTEAGAAALRALEPTTPVTVIPPGVAVAPEALRRSARKDTRNALGLTEATALLVVVARLDPIKGQDVAIGAVAALDSAGRDVHLVLVGDAIVGHEGPIGAALRAHADALGVADRVTFAGHVEDPGPWQAAADVVIAASAHEAFGLSVVEALAHGRIVVASDTDGPRSILDGGRYGLLVPPGDPGALAQVLGRALDDAELRRRLARLGPSRAGEFTPDVAARRWDRALRGVGPTRCVPDGSLGATSVPPERP